MPRRTREPRAGIARNGPDRPAGNGSGTARDIGRNNNPPPEAQVCPGTRGTPGRGKNLSAADRRSGTRRGREGKKGQRGSFEQRKRSSRGVLRASQLLLKTHPLQTTSLHDVVAVLWIGSLTTRNPSARLGGLAETLIMASPCSMATFTRLVTARTWRAHRRKHLIV